MFGDVCLVCQKFVLPTNTKQLYNIYTMSALYKDYTNIILCLLGCPVYVMMCSLSFGIRSCRFSVAMSGDVRLVRPSVTGT